MKAPYAAFHCFTGSVIEIDSSFQTIMPAKSSKPANPVKKSGNFAWYLRESRRPLAALAFTAPLLLLYEAGVLLLAPPPFATEPMSGCGNCLMHSASGAYFLAPLLAVAVLLGWHHTTRQPWKLSAGVLYGMLVESAALGMALLAIAQIHARWIASLGKNTDVLSASLQENVTGLTATVVSYFARGSTKRCCFA